MTGPKGLFIAFEGGEGSGKSTQARLLSEALFMHDIRCHLTREPGDTLLGANLRSLLLDSTTEVMSRKAEALLFAADRAEHVEKVVRPMMDLGVVVICDRYIASTMAYQAYSGDLDEGTVKLVSEWASGCLYPDLTFFMDVNPVVGLERVNRLDRNRFEGKSVSYHDKVRRNYLRQRDDSWVTVDGHEPIAKVHDKILDHTLHVLHVLERFKGTAVEGGVNTVMTLSGKELTILDKTREE